MIDLRKRIQDQLVNESCFTGKCKHIFDDGELTFADLRDIFTKIFSGDLTIEEQINGKPLLITYKDGDFYVASDMSNVKKPCIFSKCDGKFCNCEKELYDAVAESLSNLKDALANLDPVQLNRFFANGQNFMLCKIICPPVDTVVDYGNKCFIVFDKLICFNDKFKEIGQDDKSAEELFGIMRSNDLLNSDKFEISQPNILKIKSLKKSKTILQELMQKLNEFINGLGWKCSLNQFIQDRYSRHIVNKALEHSLDISRNSEFVNQLSQRLSNVSGVKPTRADLSTYAKRDGINCKCQEYKDFISDLESNVDTTNEEIIKPIEELIAYAACMLMKNVEGYMSIDPSQTASKALSTLDDAIATIQDGKVDLTPEQMILFKKNLAKIEKYHEMMPACGVLIKYKGKIYKLTPNFGAANEILKLIKYK